MNCPAVVKGQHSNFDANSAPYQRLINQITVMYQNVLNKLIAQHNVLRVWTRRAFEERNLYTIKAYGPKYGPIVVANMNIASNQLCDHLLSVLKDKYLYHAQRLVSQYQTVIFFLKPPQQQQRLQQTCFFKTHSPKLVKKNNLSNHLSNSNKIFKKPKCKQGKTNKKRRTIKIDVQRSVIGVNKKLCDNINTQQQEQQQEQQQQTQTDRKKKNGQKKKNRRFNFGENEIQLKSLSLPKNENKYCQVRSNSALFGVFEKNYAKTPNDKKNRNNNNNRNNSNRLIARIGDKGFVCSKCGNGKHGEIFTTVDSAIEHVTKYHK